MFYPLNYGERAGPGEQAVGGAIVGGGGKSGRGPRCLSCKPAPAQASALGRLLHLQTMRSRLITHRCTHWLAIFVVWFAALAPTLSQALKGPAAAMLDEICSAAGFVVLAADGASTPADDPGPGHVMGDFEHCPFCLLQGHASALPSQPPAAAVPAGLRLEAPRLFLQAGHTLHVWASAQARAPPLLA